jgi:hypothetical protein
MQWQQPSAAKRERARHAVDGSVDTGQGSVDTG